MKTKTKVIMWIVIGICLIIAAYYIGYYYGAYVIMNFINEVGPEAYCKISEMCG